MTVSKVGTGFSTVLAGIIAGPNDGLGTVTDGKVEVVSDRRVEAARQPAISMRCEFLDASMLEGQRGEGE
jgi:hypothetical protein